MRTMRSVSVATLLAVAVLAARPLALRQTPTVQLIPQSSHTAASLRGLSVVDSRVAWASGSGGTFLRTLDAGHTWVAGTVPGAEELDFRDVEAFGADTAVLLSIGAGESSRIYRTTDGGGTWRLQYRNTDPRVFLDCIAFWDARRGIALGDPVDGRFVILTTEDGVTWSRVDPEGIPPALPGEAAFAASGTALTVEGQGGAWIGTGGGAEARVFRSTDRGRHWQVAATPVAAGTASAGIFSLAFDDPSWGVAVGGDYTRPREASENVAVTADGGATWTLVGRTPYASAVALVPGSRALIAVGQDWAGFSADGHGWAWIGRVGYHAVAMADSTAGWAVGPEGRIARIRLHY